MPHDFQMIEEWSSDTRNNIALLAIAEMRNVHDTIPGSIGWTFNFEEDAFFNGKQKLTEEDLENAVAAGKPKHSGVGIATLRRSIITATALKAARNQTVEDFMMSKSHGIPSSLNEISYSLGIAE